MSDSLTGFARSKLAELEALGQRRALEETQSEAGQVVRRGGRRLVNFSSNDYLGLSQAPRVIAAARAATRAHGAGAGASRLVTGSHPLLRELETALARHKGSEAALVFGSGYLANLGIVPALAGAPDLILVDALAHACLHGGAQLSRARHLVFPHNDIDALAALLAAHRPQARHVLILTDTVFSMDGDLAPLAALGDLAERFDAWLMTDDAHGHGVVRAVRANPAPLQMGTLSKALGSYGGYLCAPREVIDLLVSRARSFVYTTGLPPASAAAALEALTIIEADLAAGGTLCARPLTHARAFARRLGLDEPQSPIVPMVLGDEKRTLAASAALERAGFLVTAIRPPTVPAGTARLRITFSAAHEDADVARLAEAVAAHVLAPAP